MFVIEVCVYQSCLCIIATNPNTFPSQVLRARIKVGFIQQQIEQCCGTSLVAIGNEGIRNLSFRAI